MYSTHRNEFEQGNESDWKSFRCAGAGSVKTVGVASGNTAGFKLTHPSFLSAMWMKEEEEEKHCS